MSKLKRCLILLLVVFVSFNFVACTSSEDDTSVLEDELENLDNEEAELSDELDGDDEFADIEDDELRDELDDDDELDEFGEDEEFAEFEDDEDDADFDEFDEEDEQALAKELGQDQGYPKSSGQPSFPEEVVAQQNPIPPQQNIPPPPPMNQPPAQDPFITSETKDLGMIDDLEEQMPQDDLGKADPLIPEEEVNKQNQNWVPVVKIKEDAFFRNDRLMNTVYIARPDESLSSISEKIFGNDQSGKLLEDNSHLAKGVDPGDKVYYNSPNRSDDKSSLKVYYDDIGLRPQKYVTNRGDNMRRLGSKLLGFSEGWKEIWAINPAIDSKTVLPPGTEIRYWTGEEQPIEAPALTEEIPTEQVPPEEQVAKATTEEMPPIEPVEPPPEAIAAELPPEPPLPEATISEDEAMDPELLVDADIEPLPEDDLSDIPNDEMNPAAMGKTADQSTGLLTTAAVALLVFAGAALVAIQIKRRKDQTAVTPPSLEYTQV